MARVALLIGVSNYGQGFQSLPETPGDVNAMQRVLGDPAIGGFQSIRPLIDPDPYQMLEAIEETFTNRNSEDLVLLFFSGHGIKDENGALYFGTKLTRKNDRGQLLKSSAVPVKQVHELISHSPAAQQIIIVDCCFSGAFADSLTPADDQLSVETIFETIPKERVILTSSTAAQYSLTSMQYSYKQLGLDLSTYTCYLVEGIETGAADWDGDGMISIAELHEYTRNRVQIAAPAMQPKLYARERGYQIRLTQAPQPGPELVYRREVTDWIRQGEISPAGHQALELRRHQLQLSEKTAREIETAVLRPYREHQQRLERYKQALLEAIQREHLLSRENQQRLERLRQVLGLSEESVAVVTLQLEEYGRCLQRYQQALVDVVQREYPLDHYAAQEMQRLQKVLGLTDKDTGAITDRVEEYRRRLQYYERAFVETIQREYPLTDESRLQLQRLQQMLDLSDEDVLSLGQRIEEYKKRLYQYQQELTDMLLESLPMGNGTPLPQWRSILNLTDEQSNPISANAPTHPIPAPPQVGSRESSSTPEAPPADQDPSSVAPPAERGASANTGPKTTLQSPETAVPLPEIEPPVDRTTSGPSPSPATLGELPLYLYPPSSGAPPIPPPPIEQRIAQESIATKSDRRGDYALYNRVNTSVEQSIPVEQSAPLTPDPPTAPTSPDIYNALFENIRTNMSAAALVGILLGIVIGGIGCLLILNMAPGNSPSPPSAQPIPSPQQ